MEELQRIRCLQLAALVAASLYLTVLSKKRGRDDDDTDDDVAQPVKRLRNNADRGTMRVTVMQRILALHDSIFKFTPSARLSSIPEPLHCRKMFRMDKQSFLLLHSRIQPQLTASKTPRSAKMAKLSSISQVDSALMLACTIRWLAGGSPWDICFGFHVAYSTLHANKYAVIHAINDVLKVRGMSNFIST